MDKMVRKYAAKKAAKAWFEYGFDLGPYQEELLQNIQIIGMMPWMKEEGFWRQAQINTEFVPHGKVACIFDNGEISVDYRYRGRNSGLAVYFKPNGKIHLRDYSIYNDRDYSEEILDNLGKKSEKITYRGGKRVTLTREMPQEHDKNGYIYKRV